MSSDEFDDEFDDFNEAASFGSFDDTAGPVLVAFPEQVFGDAASFHASLTSVINTVFDADTTEPPPPQSPQAAATPLLSLRSQEIYGVLSTMPRLKPPNWIKLNIRHNLLVKLGVPINLDEVAAPAAHSHLEVPRHGRKKSVSVHDINWGDATLPEVTLSPDDRARYLADSHDILSRIETDNLDNTSRAFLESTSDEVVLQKLVQLQNNYNELLRLGSVCNAHMEDLTANFDIYEGVVQNLIGYSQKLRRDEILDNLKKVKRGKKLWQ